MTDIFRKHTPRFAHRALVDSGSRPFYRALSDRGGEALIDGRRVIMAASNDYLGLSTDQRVIAAATTALKRFGSSCSGSPSVNGTLLLHQELERRLAAFLGREAVVVTTTGFQANLAIAALLGMNDAVFTDMSNHASLVDGVRLGFAVHHKYRHSDMAHLESRLSRADPALGKLILTDGMFSVEGDLCRLPEIVALARRHGARVAVDGAHDIGLLGTKGRGVGEYFGLDDGADLITGTFSKCFGSVGGLLAGPQDVIDYLRYNARSVLFSASMPAPAVAAALAALDIVESEPERRDRVFDLTERLHTGLRAQGYRTGSSMTPVIPVHIGDEELGMRVWQGLFDAGVFTNVMTAPVVPRGRALIRVMVQATHTEAHVDAVLDAFASVGRRLGLIPPTAPGDFPPVVLARRKPTPSGS
ncbi:aminotransferase class I/II-fold pyridoxal phosphate-dependent enzyme [Streptomyces abikoensis]|uniref:8-amino-7-oxononanoate synthase n=1 Tax=Streptomyces abikoensis TaxID=97398 RepID=A0ABW7TCP1_9ACTN